MFAFMPVAMVEGKIVCTGSGIKKGDFADDVGEASDKQGECARCELSGVVIVEWDLGDQLGDEAGVGLGGVNAILVEVEGETGAGEGGRGGGSEKGVGDGDRVRRGRGQRGEVGGQRPHR